MGYAIRVVPRPNSRIIRLRTKVRTPYGLEIIENCLSCPVRQSRIFCDLPERALKDLDAISSSATYPKNAILFVEGQEPRGVFVLCNGRVKLTAGSADGKSLILRIADPGEIVGLPGTISGKPYELTAEVLEPMQANFIPRETFLRFLREHGDAALRVAQILSEIYHATCQEVRYLGLSGSAAEKLARFLLNWTDNHSENGHPSRAVLTLTHEEIAEMIGASRETVTRLFADFKRQHLIEVRGSTLLISNKPGLQEFLDL
jgi:CRP/FNR family cyclic AMP-dependent transcriptional regulator